MSDVAPAPAGREASKDRMVEPPEERVQPSDVNLAGARPLRGLVECLAFAFAFVEADGAGAGDADTKERLRRTYSRAQRF